MRTPNPHFRLVLACAVILLLGLSAPDAAGQERTADSAVVAARFERGVRYYHEGRYAEARPLLQATFEALPELRKGGSSAAYWLGRTHEQLGAPEAMREAWWAGIQALDHRRADLIDVPLLDAYVQSVYAAGDRAAYNRAAHAYLRMLGALPDLPPGRIRRIVQQHALQAALLLPDGLRRDLLGRVPDAAAWPAPEWPPHPGAGAELVAWWRSQDPLPGTPENERLHEHLERVAHARTRYASEPQPTGLDARGEVYVRLGPPHREHSVSVTDPHLIRTMAAAHASASEVPNNVLWYYQDIDFYAFYLFVEEERYRLGTVPDLLPPSLQGPAPSQRGTEHARLLITLLRNLYGQLTLFHPSYTDRYVDIDNYAGRLSDADLMKTSEFVVAQMHARQQEESGEQNQSSDNTSTGLVGYIPSPPALGALPELHPDEFAHTTLQKIRAEAYSTARHRAQVVPAQHSQVLRGTLPLAVAARAARFLNPDGSTRVEVSWSPQPGALERARQRQEDAPSAALPSAGALLLDLAAVQRAADYVQRSFTKQRFRIEGLPASQIAVLPPQTTTFEGDTTTFHIGLQWDLYAPMGDADRDPLAPPLGTGLYRFDSLEALQADAHRLEMSDLVPLLAPGEGTDPKTGLPYPFDTIGPDTELTLLFELYHLTYSEEDRTHYTVEYEINRAREERGFLRSLFGRRGEQQQTAARTSYTGSQRTTREYIQLDLSQWMGEGTLQIVVRATDETTGQSAERTISFDVGP